MASEFKKLKWRVDGNGQDAWVYLDDYLSFLTSANTKDDALTIKRFNLEREINGHKDGIKEIDGQKAISRLSVIRHIFNHVDQMAALKAIADDIIQYTFCIERQKTNTPDSSQEQTVFNLYRELSKQDFLSCACSLMKDWPLDNSMIPTIVCGYKDCFSSNEWHTIQLFEWHYSLQCNDKPGKTLSAAQQCSRKWKYFEHCKQVRDIAHKFQSETQHTIRNRKSRTEAASQLSSVGITGALRHRPDQIEQSISAIVKEHFSPPFDVIVMTHRFTANDNSVDIAIEINQDSDYVDLLAQTIVTSCVKDHALKCRNIYFLQKGTLEIHKLHGKTIQRLCFNDSIVRESSIASRVWKVLDTSAYVNNEPELTDGGEKLCKICFSPDLPTPLNVSSFDLGKEWVLDVPMSTQILLCSFINTNTTRRKDYDSLAAYIKSHIQRLYIVYDTLLNTYNRKHHGIIQKLITDELIMNFHNIGAVFDLTCKAGLTMSHTSAELKVQDRADNDIRFYETYLKHYPLTYQTMAGMITNHVNMRQCHPILMLDNLVRLKTKEDPDPGESRTKQICTIPITIQGLPKDHVITESWHNPEICDSTSSCACKKEVSLKPEDIESKILTLTDEEQCCLSKAKDLLIWGCNDLWAKIKDQVPSLILLANSALHSKAGKDDKDMSNSFLQDDEQLHGKCVDESIELDELISSFNISCTVEEQSFNNVDMFYESPSVPSSSVPSSSVPSSSVPSSSVPSSSVPSSSVPSSSVPSSSVPSSSVPSSSDTQEKQENILHTFGLNKTNAPPLLTRHPPPAAGRDDDIMKWKEILDDILDKLGYHSGEDLCQDRIMCGPDNKICSNLLKLMERDIKYKAFLPEFPILHLRKSKITTLLSAYKDTGLGHLFRYMRDESTKELSSVVGLHHIDVATKHIKRMGQSLHVAFFIKFMSQLSEQDRVDLFHTVTCGSDYSERWCVQFDDFMKEGCKKNATFALHRDWMTHCDEVVFLQLAERLGGKDGYLLLLATVKSSLTFQFLNGASSYAPFCVDLLNVYYKCGPFHQAMKHCMFSTPIGQSNVNFATDTKREMEHITAIKMLRAGATEASVLRRMAIVDSIQAVSDIFASNTPEARSAGDVKWNFTDTDVNHILPTVELILRRGGLCLEDDDVPYNVYAPTNMILSRSLLDICSENVGNYLVKRCVFAKRLFGCNPNDCLDVSSLQGPKELVQRAKSMKGVTLRRAIRKTATALKSERMIREEKRQKALDKRMEEADCLTSDMNTCQALVKPDCTKPRVDKSRTMPIALQDLVGQCPSVGDSLILLNQDSLPSALCDNVQIVTVEFAGTKYKANKGVTTGMHYLRLVESNVFKPILYHFKNAQRLVICEEKYSFTPDDFKAATRKQREVLNKQTIAHLKAGENIISDSKFSKEAAITTAEGKCMISNFLAANVEKINIKKDLVLDIDSELHRGGCLCTENVTPCTCAIYAVPLRCIFSKDGFVSKELMHAVKQCKGEAELAQVDWLLESIPELERGKAVVSFVSSGDIDAVVIHLFAISLHWPRNEDGKFVHPVYVVLQKHAKSVDFYDVTGILETLEEKFEDLHIGVKVAVGLCMGGNDFVPKFYSMAHKKVLQLALADTFRSTLVHIHPPEVTFNEEMFPTFVKHLYSGGKSDKCFEEVRQKSMFSSVQRKNDSKYRNPKLWMPPSSALMKVAKIITLQIEYLQTVGCPAAKLPAFLTSGCFVKDDLGNVEYNFGEETFQDVTPMTVQNVSSKRKANDLTPRKDKSAKKQLTSTPKKSKESSRRLHVDFDAIDLSS